MPPVLLELVSRQKNDELIVLLLNQEKELEVFRKLLTRLSTSAWESYLAKNINLIDTYVLKECPHGENEMWSLEFSKKVLDQTVTRLENKSHSFDYSIGLTISEFLHLDCTLVHVWKSSNEVLPDFVNQKIEVVV